ncbi:ATP-binding protein [Paenibacillus sp. sgz302251]|uniref:ATP-binding protein n=1 Tax=Paenibacillus sp. sgz302251 TaxID=3414493 RepID=UPI003C7DDBC6
MEIIEELSVNMLILFFPIFIYHLFEPKLRNKQKLFIGAASGLAIILCMSFPLDTLRSGHIFDLRQIPLILSGLYGGLYSLISSFLVLIGYRFYLGGEGAFGAFWVNSILTCLMVIVHVYRKHKFTTSLQRIVLGSMAALIGSAITFSIFTLFIDTYTPQIIFKVLKSLLALTLFQCVGIIMLLLAIEQLRKNHIIRQQLAHQEKTEIVSQLAASISHEVRNPLTAVRGFIQLMRNDHIDPIKRKEYIAITLEELDRAESIISGYLQFAKQRPSEIKLLHLYEELDSVVKLMEPYALNKGVTLIGPTITYERHMLGDSGLFRQCMLNVVKNALEATPPNGKVEIAIIGTIDKISIEIKDTGVGMDKEQIRRLGEPYFSTKTQGTGLGMMVTYSGVQHMGGVINVESKIGQGTRFMITFPNGTS